MEEVKIIFTQGLEEVKIISQSYGSFHLKTYFL